ncbi:hypothetical protein DM02DRAFT_661905 [Periconia macrospinosa]|uniref:Uncharacterized protein n=1 Tax=Periconia macrospinosa TaxID=97972 RepID=A0A2V1D5X6_9PLEO|nr:hypothetical protein DM02DRAFT_661905 [Periconia macrospinosa]
MPQLSNCILFLMDLFTFYPEHRVLVCKSCAYAVSPAHLRSHIATKHPHDPCRAAGLDPAYSRPRKPAATLAGSLQEKYDILDPSLAKIPLPPPTHPPFRELKLYRGYQCSRCDYVLSKTKEARKCMEQHFNTHRLLPRKPGRPGKIADIPADDKGPMFFDVFCQPLRYTFPTFSTYKWCLTHLLL